MKIKLLDFGKSLFSEGSKISDYNAGSAYYLAPEIITNSPHDSKIDLWSIGVLTFFLLSGDIPFYGDDTDELYDQTVKSELDMSDQLWDFVS